MNQVREALAVILPKRNDILSMSAYALQADKLQGRSATIMRAQGVEASVGIYGCTCFGQQRASYAPEYVNVAVSRAIDLFPFVTDRRSMA